MRADAATPNRAVARGRIGINWSRPTARNACTQEAFNNSSWKEHNPEFLCAAVMWRSVVREGVLEGLHVSAQALSSAFSPTGRLSSPSRLAHLRHLAVSPTSRTHLIGCRSPVLSWKSSPETRTTMMSSDICKARYTLKSCNVCVTESTYPRLSA